MLREINLDVDSQETNTKSPVAPVITPHISFTACGCWRNCGTKEGNDEFHAIYR